MNYYLVDETVLAARVEDDIGSRVEHDIVHRHVAGAQRLDGRHHKGCHRGVDEEEEGEHRKDIPLEAWLGLGLGLGLGFLGFLGFFGFLGFLGS